MGTQAFTPFQLETGAWHLMDPEGCEWSMRWRSETSWRPKEWGRDPLMEFNKCRSRKVILFGTGRKNLAWDREFLKYQARNESGMEDVRQAVSNH